MYPDPASLERRNHGLRLAFAVALGLVFEILRGALVPPLAAVIALQLLALPGPRPTAKMVVGFFVVIGRVAVRLWRVGADGGLDTPLRRGCWADLPVGVRSCRAAEDRRGGSDDADDGHRGHDHGGPSTALAGVLVAELLISVAFGIALMFLAHALFPSGRCDLRRGGGDGADLWGWRAGAGGDSHRAAAAPCTHGRRFRRDGRAAHRGDHAPPDADREGRGLCGKLHRRQSAGRAVGGSGGHGGEPARHHSGARHRHAASALIIAWWLERVPALAHVLLPGFVGFAVLFGLAFTSSSSPADVELVRRLGQIVAASLYALCAISPHLPLAHRLQPPAGAPAA